MSATAAAHWPEALAALRAQLGGVLVEMVDEVDSSNSALLRRARAGSLPPTLLIARRQSAARGRMGRAWVAEPDGALTFSLALPLVGRDWSGLSLAVGLALAEALHPAIRIKWPNDLHIGTRKLAGILIETASSGGGGESAPRCAVIGIGINLRAPAAGSAAAAALAASGAQPAWLEDLLPGESAPAVLARCAAPLTAAVRAFERAGFAPLLARYAARDALAGRTLTCSDGTTGCACGVAPDGALRLRTPHGIAEIRSGAVSVRPAPATPPAQP